jgi:hypothetical protein
MEPRRGCFGALAGFALAGLAGLAVIGVVAYASAHLFAPF